MVSSAPISNAPTPALLLKLLFTSEPLSIQVHPDDAFARAMGLPNGKTEAWYILSATPDAQVAVGLKRRITPQRIARRRSGTVRLPTWFSGARLRKATSSSSLPAPSTPSAPASCLRKFSSAATRHSVCSTMAGSASCTKTTPSRLPMPGRFKRQCDPDPPHRRPNSSRSRASISFWSGLTSLSIRAGRCLLSRRPGFSCSMATPRLGWPPHPSGRRYLSAAIETSIEVGAHGLSGLIAYPGPDPIDSLLQKPR